MPRAGVSVRALVITGLIFVMTQAVSAELTMQDCGQMQDDSGERLKCRFGNLIVQQKQTNDMLMKMGQFPDVSDTRMERLDNMMKRSERSLERIPSDDFKQLVRKRVSGCFIVPLDPEDEDGECRGNEECEEVIGDGIGDDVQPCKTKGRPSDREVCVEVCSEEGNTDPRGFDDDPADPTNLAADMEEELEDITADYAELNQMLAKQMQLRSDAEIVLNDPEATACEKAASAIKARRDNSVMITWIAVTEGLNLLEQICDAAGDFHIGPVPAKVVCGVAAAAASAAQITHDLYDNEDGNIDSDTIDVTLECVQDLTKSAGGVDEQLMAVRMDLEIVKNQLAMAIRLLNTPQGRRDDFPLNPQP